MTRRKRVSNADKKEMFLYYWRLLAPQSAPQPEPEYRFAPPRRFRFDWVFRDYRIAVEVDGGVWMPNGGYHAQDGDREKLNLAASLRWLVFRFSPQMLTRDPDACIEQVWQALRDSQ